MNKMTYRAVYYKNQSGEDMIRVPAKYGVMLPVDLDKRVYAADFQRYKEWLGTAFELKEWNNKEYREVTTREWHKKELVMRLKPKEEAVDIKTYTEIEKAGAMRFVRVMEKTRGARVESSKRDHAIVASLAADRIAADGCMRLAFPELEDLLEELVETGTMMAKMLIAVSVYSALLNRDTVGAKFSKVFAMTKKVPLPFADWNHTVMSRIGMIMLDGYRTSGVESEGFTRMCEIFEKRKAEALCIMTSGAEGAKTRVRLDAEKWKMFVPPRNKETVNRAWRMIAEYGRGSTRKGP